MNDDGWFNTSTDAIAAVSNHNRRDIYLLDTLNQGCTTFSG